MHRLIIEINREYTKNEINKKIDELYNVIKKLSLENDNLKKSNESIQKEKAKFARAYAREIGLILTQKEYNKKFPEYGLDESEGRK